MAGRMDGTAGGHGAGGRPVGKGWRVLVWVGAGVLLALPWVAMQVTDEVAWDAADFAIFGVMLAGACVAWEAAMRVTGRRAYRVLAGLVILTAFLLVWAQLAVGLFGPG